MLILTYCHLSITNNTIRLFGMMINTLIYSGGYLIVLNVKQTKCFGILALKSYEPHMELYTLIICKICKSFRTNMLNMLRCCFILISAEIFHFNIILPFDIMGNCRKYYPGLFPLLKHIFVLLSILLNVGINMKYFMFE